MEDSPSNTLYFLFEILAWILIGFFICLFLPMRTNQTCNWPDSEEMQKFLTHHRYLAEMKGEPTIESLNNMNIAEIQSFLRDKNEAYKRDLLANLQTEFHYSPMHYMNKQEAYKHLSDFNSRNGTIPSIPYEEIARQELEDTLGNPLGATVPIPIRDQVKNEGKRRTRSMINAEYEKYNLPININCSCCRREGKLCKQCFLHQELESSPASSSPP